VLVTHHNMRGAPGLIIYLAGIEGSQGAEVECGEKAGICGKEEMKGGRRGANVSSESGVVKQGEIFFKGNKKKARE